MREVRYGFDEIMIKSRGCMMVFQLMRVNQLAERFKNHTKSYVSWFYYIQVR